MSFEAQDKGEILKRLQTNLKAANNEQSIVEGTFNADMLTANALEFEQVDAEMELMMEAAFARTSWGPYLTMIAEQYGVVRKTATNAIGKVTVTGQPRARIIKGSLFATLNEVKFYTTEAAEVGENGTVEIPIIAELPGTIGVVAANQITAIPMSIPNITGVTNEADTYDGFEEETDAELLKRYLLKVRTPATSGNKYHSQQWALSVQGVGQCKVIPRWAGNGTVKVIILDANNGVASAEVIQAVADYIEEERPIGATVTVTSPAPLTIDISADIVGSAEAEEVKQAVDEFLRAGGFNIKKVSLAQIGRILMSVGNVADYDNLTLNGQAQSVIIDADSLPACGEVTLHVVEE